MKTSIPDSGTVIRLDGERAVVRMKHDGSCRGCGAAAMGLCKGGLMQELAVRNPLAARVGDTVSIGLVNRVQYAGYFLAYVAPAAAFVAGAAAGYNLGERIGFPALDVMGGFVSTIAVSFFSYRRLRRLDSSHAIEIVHVESAPWLPEWDGGATGARHADQAQPGLYR